MQQKGARKCITLNPVFFKKKILTGLLQPLHGLGVPRLELDPLGAHGRPADLLQRGRGVAAGVQQLILDVA